MVDKDAFAPVGCSVRDSMQDYEKEKSRPMLPLTYEPKPFLNTPVSESRLPALTALGCSLTWWAVLEFASTAAPSGGFLGTTRSYALFALLAVGSIALIAALLHEQISWPTRVAAALLATSWVMTLALLFLEALRGTSDVDLLAFPFPH